MTELEQDESLGSNGGIGLWMEIIVGKGESAGYHHFLFPMIFSKGLHLGDVKFLSFAKWLNTRMF